MDEKIVGHILSGGSTMGTAIITVVVVSLWRIVEFLFARVVKTEDAKDASYVGRLDRLEEDMTALRKTIEDIKEDYTPRVAVIESSLISISNALSDLKELPSALAVFNRDMVYLSNQIEELRKHGGRKN